MTTRQIRIACCGMVVSTRPFPSNADVDAVARETLETIDALLDAAPVVDMWVVQGNLISAMKRYREPTP